MEKKESNKTNTQKSFVHSQVPRVCTRRISQDDSIAQRRHCSGELFHWTGTFRQRQRPLKLPHQPYGARHRGHGNGLARLKASPRWSRRAVGDSTQLQSQWRRGDWSSIF